MRFENYVATFSGVAIFDNKINNMNLSSEKQSEHDNNVDMW
jgi:hypothetical protein